MDARPEKSGVLPDPWSSGLHCTELGRRRDHRRGHRLEDIGAGDTLALIDVGTRHTARSRKSSGRRKMDGRETALSGLFAEHAALRLRPRGIPGHGSLLGPARSPRSARRLEPEGFDRSRGARYSPDGRTSYFASRSDQEPR